MKNSSQNDRKGLLARKEMSKSFLLWAKLISYRKFRRLEFLFLWWQMLLFPSSLLAPGPHCWPTEGTTFSPYPAEFQNNPTGGRQYTKCEHPPFPMWSISFLSLGHCVPGRPRALPFWSINGPSTKNTVSPTIYYMTWKSINITSTSTAQRISWYLFLSPYTTHTNTHTSI